MKIKTIALLLSLFSTTASAAISTRLSDNVRSGVGAINLLKDISGTQLTQQISSGGKLFFGMDINENASGNETAASIGVALQNVELTVTTTTGTYRFSNFATNTSAILSKAGSTELNTYYTLFGQTGSSQLTGTSAGFDLSSFDDVLVLNNVSFTGDVLSASMNVQLLDTGNSRATSDTFFDFSGGYEDIALLSMSDALALETASIGVAGAPVGLTSTTTTQIITAAEVAAATNPSTSTPPTTTTSTPTPPSAPPAAPAPAMWSVLALSMIFFVALGRKEKYRQQSLSAKFTA